MTGSPVVIITDTSPLITLAVAGALDLLLLANCPVKIPDAVYFEATRIPGAAGATDIVGWVKRNSDKAHIVPTETGLDQQRRFEEKRTIRNLGEAAAFELLEMYRNNPDSGRIIMLFEDVDAFRRRSLLEDRVALLTTGDFLRELEELGIVPSAEAILDNASAAGRNIDKLR
jgi:hypothetical protein